MTRQAGRPRDTAKESFWREMVRRHAQSGLTVRGFCDEHMLDERAFLAWRRKLGALDRESRGAARLGQVKAVGKPSAFARIQLEPDLGVEDATVEIVLTGRERVRVKAGFDRATLAAVLDVLEGRP